MSQLNESTNIYLRALLTRPVDRGITKGRSGACLTKHSYNFALQVSSFTP